MGILNYIMHFLEALVDLMDVVDVAENDLTVSVVTNIFKTATFDPVGLCIKFGPGIVNHDLRIANHRLRVFGGAPYL